MILIDIFSSLDFGLRFAILHNPFILLILLFIIYTLTISINSFWIHNTRLLTLSKKITYAIYSISNIKTTPLNGLSITIITLFFTLVLLNFSGLIPYRPSLTSHLYFTFPIALTIWSALILSNLTTSPKKFFARFLPSGAPTQLSPFLILIEIIRIRARPITLAFRLAANISTGHVILSLIGSYAASYIFTAYPSFSIVLLIKSLYIILELGICIIQAYIFTLLITIYAREHH